MRYTKHYSSPAELLAILQDRGLDCSDIDDAESILRSIGYYRLSGYLYPFLKVPKSEHRYKSGSTLGSAVSLYEFDREFRQLRFARADKFGKTLALIDKEIQTSREDFIVHFKQSYEDPYPPSWMIAEIIPLGTEGCTVFRSDCPRFRFMDDHCHADPELMLSPCKAVESFTFFACADHDKAVAPLGR